MTFRKKRRERERDRDKMREREREREREKKPLRERNIIWLLLVGILPGDQTHNLAMCPDQELNPQPFGP